MIMTCCVGVKGRNKMVSIQLNEVTMVQRRSSPFSLRGGWMLSFSLQMLTCWTIILCCCWYDAGMYSMSRTLFVQAAQTKIAGRGGGASSTVGGGGGGTVRNDLIRLCEGKPPITTKKQQKHLNWLIQASGEPSLLMKSSSQHMAACWMLHVDQLYGDKNINKNPSSLASSSSSSAGSTSNKKRQQFLQRYALVVLHYSSTKANTTAWDWHMAVDDPKSISKHGDWLHPKKHECTWYGVVCSSSVSTTWWTYLPSLLGIGVPIINNGQLVIGLHLGFLKVDGLLPRELYLLSSLQHLDLHGNDLQGVLPYKLVDGLHQLEYLELHMNGFFGILPKEMASLTSLKVLRLFGNYFAGQLPTHLGELTQLEVIDMYANFLTGTIPTEFGLLKKLRVLDLHDNNIVGRVPQQICDLKLEELVVDCLGPYPEVECTCCTACCRGLPEAKCVQVSNGKPIA